MDGIYALADPSSGVAAIDMNDEFNFLGRKAYLSGRIFEPFPTIDDAPVAKEIVVEEPAEEEGSLFGNIAIGAFATAALAGLAYCAFAAATVATGGAALVLVGVCLAGAAVGTAVVTAASTVTDYKSGHVRTTKDFVSQLATGAGVGAVTAATIYGLWWAAPYVGTAAGLQASLLTGSVTTTTAITIPQIAQLGAYGLMALQGAKSLNDMIEIGSGSPGFSP